MNKLKLIVILYTLVAGEINHQASAQTVPLWNGKDFSKWALVTTSPTVMDSVCSMKPENIISISGKPIGYIVSVDTFTNYKLHLEYRWHVDAAKNSNSGVLVHIATGPIDRNTWPKCFQIQTKIIRAGDLLPMAGATFNEPLTTPAGVKTPQLERQKSDSENPIGEWNSVEIVCCDSTIECSINGIIQNRVTGCNPCTGKIGLQMEGFPYEVRNMVLQQLK